MGRPHGRPLCPRSRRRSGMSSIRLRLRRYWSTEAKDDLRFYAIFIAVYFLFQATVAANVRVPSGSMRETIKVGDRFIVLKLGYGLQDPLHPRGKFRVFERELLKWREPERGDIVMFVPPEWTGKDDNFTKRAVGLPGETVEVRGGLGVLIDGELLPEPYVLEPPRYSMDPVPVPLGHLFVLGDNRNDSYDGHMWGFLPVESVQGVLAFRYWPPGRIGRPG